MGDAGILERLGLRKNWIYETIVVTHGSDGKFNAAPMGIRTIDMETVLMDVYRDRKTHENVTESREFTVNFVSDVGSFYEYCRAGKPAVKEKILKNADACLEMSVSEIDDLGDKVRIEAHVKGGKIIRNTVLINRAEALALECVVASTKSGIIGKVEAMKKIEEYLGVISRVAPRSRYEELARRLLDGMKDD
jgi:hypothetical protein